ncbi:MAG: hypothetical protein WKF30_08690 [Pyrinomonadaceae bacterium]
MPLNVADYARVPLLNPDQLVGSWREMLPPLDSEYDTRMVTLGEREAGVYLVEAVAGDLRAYTIAVVSDLTLINKTSPSGVMTVFAADRKTGAPRQNVRLLVSKGGADVAQGLTDGNGILKTEVKKNQTARTPTPASEDEEEGDGETDGESSPDSYLVMAMDREHFAISDLEPYYFGDYEGDEEYGGGSQALTSYVYTDRPVYRPIRKSTSKAFCAV